MAIYKRGDVYWFEFIFNGRRIRRSTMQSNRREAENIASAYRTSLARGMFGITEPKAVPSLKKAVELFLGWCKVEHANHPNTHKRYETASKPLLRFFKADTPLDQITRERVEAYKEWRARQRRQRPVNAKVKSSKKEQGSPKALRPATINRELACLKILLNHNEDSVPVNPVRKVKFLDEDNLQMRVLSADEERRYLLAATQPLRDIATVMLETGMRPEEVCRIRREYVHLDEGYVLIPFGKTKAARRKIALSDKTLAILARRLEKTEGAYLFPGRGVGDNPLVKVNNAHNGAVVRSRVPHFRLYDCRHTFATRAAMAGVDLVTLAALLGHSRLTMVLRYAHPTEEHQFEAMRKVAEYSARKAAQK